MPQREIINCESFNDSFDAECDSGKGVRNLLPHQTVPGSSANNSQKVGHPCSLQTGRDKGVMVKLSLKKEAFQWGL